MGRIKIVVHQLVKLGLNVNDRIDRDRPDGRIWHAVGKGHIEVVRWMLEQGATINHVYNGRPRCFALKAACRGGDINEVKLLIDYRADIHTSWHGVKGL